MENVEKRKIEVVAAIIIKDGKLFATQRGYGDFKDGWEFPGGKMEAGETMQQALARELREELELDVEVGELIKTIKYDYPKFHLTMHCLRVTKLNNEPKLLEHESARWLTKDEVDGVDWLPADLEIIDIVKDLM